MKFFIWVTLLFMAIELWVIGEHVVVLAKHFAPEAVAKLTNK